MLKRLLCIRRGSCRNISVWKFFRWLVHDVILFSKGKVTEGPRKVVEQGILGHYEETRTPVGMENDHVC